jgi:hypothetical protein
MTQEERRKSIENILKSSIIEKEARFNYLDSKLQTSLTEIDRIEYIVLKYDLRGRKGFYSDPYCTILLLELISQWIKENKLGGEGLFVILQTMLMDWLIDWEKSSDTTTNFHGDMLENLHTILNPFCEEVETITSSTFRSKHLRNRNLAQPAVDFIYEEVFTPRNQETIPLLLSLFKIKYAVESAREYLNASLCQKISVDDQFYSLDVVGLTHIFLRHTERYKSLQHMNNTNLRGFFNFESGKEYEGIHNILENIEASHINGKKYKFEIENISYIIILNDERIISLYPEN